MEIWKPVVGFEGRYAVSNLGRVKNVKTKRIKKPTPDKKDGRLFLLLWNGNKAKAVRVGRLVLLAFRGPPPNGHEGCHNDGNPANNRLTNLRWDTPSANQRDRVRHGTSNRGEQCGTSKLTEKQVLAIREDGRLQREIAEEYGVQQSVISRIKSGVRWGHLRSKI